MLNIRKVHPRFAVEVTGVDLKTGCTAAVGAEIRALLIEHGVVVLPRQNLIDIELEALGGYLGDVFKPPKNARSAEIYGEGVFALGNIAPDGSRKPADDRAWLVNVSNQLWHTDQTYLPQRAEFSFLTARITPPTGGETEFCDTRVAYEGLSDERKKTVDPLFAYHSLRTSRAKTGFKDWTPEELKLYQDIRRPLVHTHESGRRALCVASHIGRIDGYEDTEAVALVEDLIAAATTPDRVYSHRWQVGDLVIWDNRCTMHRATPFDDQAYGRDMRSMRTLDRLPA